jgi:MFS family permease
LAVSLLTQVDRRQLLITTQTLSIVPALLLAGLTLSGQITVGWIMGLAFLLGTVNAIELPARQAFLAELVTRSELTSAITSHSVVFNATRIIGPILAGFTIATAGLSVCFLINAFSFLAGISSIAVDSAPNQRPYRHKNTFQYV